MTSPEQPPSNVRPLAPVVVTCPSCGKHSDAATAGDGSAARPRVGATGICIYCVDVFRFGAEGAEALSKDEWVEAMADPDVRNLRTLLRQVKERSGR